MTRKSRRKGSFPGEFSREPPSSDVVSAIEPDVSHGMPSGDIIPITTEELFGPDPDDAPEVPTNGGGHAAPLAAPASAAADLAPLDNEPEPAPFDDALPHAQGGIRSFMSRLMGREPAGAEGAPVASEDITPELPVGDHEKVVEMRSIRPPYSFVRIVFNEERSTYRYEVVEPPLTQDEAESYAFIKDAFLRSLDVDLGTLDRQGARAYLSREYESLAKRHGLRLSALSRARIGYFLERDFLGFGLIDPIMNDPNIEDISCDGPKLPVFIFHRRYESVRTNVVFPSDEALDGFVMQLVQRSGKHISVADPLVDATLPDGSRLQASLSREVTTRGSTFTIRRFRKDPFTPTDLLTFETMSAEMMAYWWLAVEHGASAIICGGTASGKTTTLNALSLFIPPNKKIVSIEDTRELNIPHDNWIPGVTRSGGAAGGSGESSKRVGEVDMFDLLKAALRQRPEYLLLGEVRGREAYVLFQAMATGHTVYSTMHADSVQSAVHRLESKPLEIPRNMLSSLDIFTIQGETKVGGKRVRKMREIVELTGIDARTGELITNRVFFWDPSESQFKYSGVSFVLGRVAEEANLAEDALRKEFDRRVRILATMQKKSIRDLAAVSRVIVDYAVDPERTLADLEANPGG